MANVLDREFIEVGCKITEILIKRGVRTFRDTHLLRKSLALISNWWTPGYIAAAIAILPIQA